MPTSLPVFAFDHSYARDLPGFYALSSPQAAAAPRLLYVNHALAEELRLDLADVDEPTLAACFSGNRLPDNAMPLAQAYAGHQFGHYSPQLGDGRALLIGELIDQHAKRRDVAFKGSGRTPFSRGGDGKAAVGPMLREVLIGEAMQHLGIPSTRALAVVATGDTVYRGEPLPGAVLTRIAASHIRVGTFEYFARRGGVEAVQQLLDYTVARHDPALVGQPQAALAFLQAVALRQATLVAQWLNVGFIHGVMNTDNMTISGETIDYGPCAFMEAYDPQTVFSSIDEHGRYAYANQPNIAQWNLARLAETLIPFLHADSEQAVTLATDVINRFPATFQQQRLQGLRAKLGLQHAAAELNPRDLSLAEDWLSLLHTHQVDFTLAWRRLADAAGGKEAGLRDLFVPDPALDHWLQRWQQRCAEEDGNADPACAAQGRAQAMRRANPWLIPRNHRVEEALAAASDHGDLKPFQQLLAALQQPYEETPACARYAEPAPTEVTACYRTFCGT